MRSTKKLDRLRKQLENTEKQLENATFARTKAIDHQARMQQTLHLNQLRVLEHHASALVMACDAVESEFLSSDESVATAFREAEEAVTTLESRVTDMIAQVQEE